MIVQGDYVKLTFPVIDCKIDSYFTFFYVFLLKLHKQWRRLTPSSTISFTIVLINVLCEITCSSYVRINLCAFLAAKAIFPRIYLPFYVLFPIIGYNNWKVVMSWPVCHSVIGRMILSSTERVIRCMMICLWASNVSLFR